MLVVQIVIKAMRTNSQKRQSEDTHQKAQRVYGVPPMILGSEFIDLCNPVEFASRVGRLACATMQPAQKYTSAVRSGELAYKRLPSLH